MKSFLKVIKLVLKPMKRGSLHSRDAHCLCREKEEETEWSVKNWKQEVQRQQGEGAYRWPRNTVEEGCWCAHWRMNTSSSGASVLRKHWRLQAENSMDRGEFPAHLQRAQNQETQTSRAPGWWQRLDSGLALIGPKSPWGSSSARLPSAVLEHSPGACLACNSRPDFHSTSTHCPCQPALCRWAVTSLCPLWSELWKADLQSSGHSVCWGRW